MFASVWKSPDTTTNSLMKCISPRFISSQVTQNPSSIHAVLVYSRGQWQLVKRSLLVTQAGWPARTTCLMPHHGFTSSFSTAFVATRSGHDCITYPAKTEWCITGKSRIRFLLTFWPPECSCSISPVSHTCSPQHPSAPTLALLLSGLSNRPAAFSLPAAEETLAFTRYSIKVFFKD